MHKMAMNVGRRPSIEDGTDMTVEVHILHSFNESNFRGRHLRVIGTGYIRCNIHHSLVCPPKGCNWVAGSDLRRLKIFGCVLP